jgi:hypothetical protein
MDRGGGVGIFDIVPYLTLKYTRVRDDISTCTITVSTDDVDCCANLAKLEAGRHEILILRNGVRVWEGPVVRITYTSSKVEIEAHDCWHYVYRTILQAEYNNTYPRTDYAVQRAQIILENELGRGWEAIDPPINVVPFLDVRVELDSVKTSRLTKAYEKTAWEEIDDMAARSGIDYTCVGRSLILFDTYYELGRTVPLSDADFDGEIIVSQYGMNLCTYSAVTDGNGGWSASKIDEDYYGPWEMLETSYTLQDALQCNEPTSQSDALAEMREQTVRNLANRYPSPVVVRIPDNSRLNPDTGLTIDDLVPGVRIPLAATQTCRKLTQEQKLDKVTFTLEGNDEVITLVMSPAPGTITVDEAGSGDSGGG